VVVVVGGEVVVQSSGSSTADDSLSGSVRHARYSRGTRLFFNKWQFLCLPNTRLTGGGVVEAIMFFDNILFVMAQRACRDDAEMHVALFNDDYRKVDLGIFLFLDAVIDTKTKKRPS
jgi:hypothetical protein